LTRSRRRSGAPRPFAAASRSTARAPRGVWDAGLFLLARVEPDFGALGSTVQPDATLALDGNEAHFAGRFRRLMDEANAHRAQPEKAAAS
jgi:hypothetical protein